MKNTAKNENQDKNAEQTPVPSPGELLRHTRKDKGFSLDEVAPHLGLPCRVLRALEDDDYERLPAPMYVRGYVRRYCSLLGISEVPVLEMVDQQLTHKGIEDHALALRLPLAPKKKIRPVLILIPLILMLLAAAAALVWAMQSSESISLSAIDKPQTTFQPAVEMSALTSENDNDHEQNFSESEPRLHAVNEAGDDGMRTLAVHIIQQSWVEVFDANGDMLVADIKPSGTTLEITGLAPFSVTLGYAPGVELTFSGQPVPVKAISSDNTATLHVGDEYAQER